MTTTLTNPGQSSHPPTEARSGHRWLLALLVVSVITIALRLFHITTAYDLFIDEAEYTDIAHSIINGHGIRLFGDPFYLHPPLFFLVLSPAVGLSAPGSPLDTILDVRYVNTLFAVANVILIMLIAKRARGTRVALVAGGLYALNPFIIKFDSRVTLETSMMTWVLLGVLLAALSVDAVRPTRQRYLLIGSGVAFGLALITKETSALVTVVPFALFLLAGRPIPRARCLTILAAQTATYIVYVITMVATGNLSPWWNEKIQGTLRALGFIQTTGYNAPHRSSLLDRLGANADIFVPAYIVIAVGSVAALVLLVRRWSEWSTAASSSATPLIEKNGLRIAVCWHAAVCLSLGYTIAFGTLEEQTFYLIAIPATLTTALATALVFDSPQRSRRAASTALAVLIFGWSLFGWAVVHFNRDDTYARFQDWAHANLAQGSRLAVTEHTGKFVLTGFRLKEVSSLRDAQASADYVLVSTELADRGLGSASQTFVDELDRTFPVIHTERGRTLGELRFYDLRQPKPAF